jgi:hypothetical protein
METTQAIQIMQNVINAAIQKGLFANVDEVTTVAVALKTIESALAPKEEVKEKK